VAVRVEGRVRRVPIEDYVLGSVLSEVVPVGEADDVVERIFEVQSVIARSYAVANLGRHRAEGFDLCDDTHCQLFQPGRITSSRFARAAAVAVRQTAGIVLMHSQRIVETLYHADCGGHTAAADAVWGQRVVPYLVGGPDDVPGARHRTWSLDLEASQVGRALQADPRTAVGVPVQSIRVEARDTGGRATVVALEGEQTRRVTGEVLRAVLNRVAPFPGVMSTRLDVSRRDGVFRFAGSGFGHGVGLCQVGAAARARRGDETSAILSAYYPGASSRRLR
jgi:stage II sporulation protein D